MTTAIPSPRSSGQFVRVGNTLPAVEVDCSAWARAPGPRAAGQFERVCESLPPVEMEFVPATDLFLELTFTLVPGADANRVFGKVTNLCERANDYERSLGGAGMRWDKEHSTAHNGTLQMVLVPVTPAGAEQRLQTLATLLVSALAEYASVDTVSARGCRVTEPERPLFEFNKVAA